MKLENELLIVEIDEGSLCTRVVDKRNGMSWKTPGPGFSVCTYMVPEECHHWYTSDSRSDASDWLGNPVRDCEIVSLTQTPVAAEFQLLFTSIELSFSARFELDAAQLTITIPKDSWDYHGELLFEVQSVDILPMFGGRPLGAEGSLVLPHGGGTLRHFKDHPGRAAAMSDALRRGNRGDYSRSHGPGAPDPSTPQSYVSLVYGINSQWRDSIWFPAWGVVTGGSGFAAYIPFEKGDVDAGIVTTANYGDEKLCAVHARYFYRHHPRDERISETRQLVLTFLSKDSVDFNDVSHVYRNYLVANAGVPTLRQRAEACQEVDYLAGAYLFVPMLALKRFNHYANPYADGSGPLDIYMTFDDVIREMERNKAAGVERALVIMVGFNREGHDGSYPDIFPVEPTAGGEEGFARAIQAMRQIEYETTVHVNLRCYSRNSQTFRYETVMRDRDGGPVVNATGPEGEDFNACPWEAAGPFRREVFPKLKAMGLDGGLYIDFVMGVLFRCYQTRHGHGTTRRDYMNGVLAYLEEAKRVFGSVRTENVIAPALSVVDTSTTLIHPRRGESYLADSELRQRGFYDESVPMMVVVYHGLVLYFNEPLTLGERDYWDLILYNLSIGAGPRDEPRGASPQFDGLHRLEYEIFCDKLKWLRFETIQRMERRGDVTLTRYEDGTVVYVNFGREALTVDGTALPGRSFHVRPGTPDHEPMSVSEDLSLTQQPPAPTPDGFRVVGRPLSGADDAAARAGEFSLKQRRAPNPVTG